jgi:glucose/arabinose dehydrogenase
MNRGRIAWSRFLIGLLAATGCSSTAIEATATSVPVIAEHVTTSPATTGAPSSGSPSAPSDEVRPPTSLTATAPFDPATVHIRATVVASVRLAIEVATRPGRPEVLWVATQDGTVRTVRDGHLGPVALDLTARTEASGERGLLGLAFSPDGAYVYVDYTDRSGDTNIDEYPVSADGTIDASGRRLVLFQKQPYPNHNGGHLAFGPDGLLYIALGDGGSAGDPQSNGQNLGTLLGKILRISPRPVGSAAYGVPADNPFVGRTGARREIWSYGLRNPWRFAFDPANGDLWIGDVGQNAVEEVDHVAAAPGAGKGVNFGWRRFEGDALYSPSTPAPDAVGPTFTYRHADGGCSVIGGQVYRGTAIAALTGVYVFADLCQDTLRAWSPATGIVDLGVTIGRVVSIEAGPAGELYLCDLNGRLLRLDPT